MDQKLKSQETKRLIIETSFDMFYLNGYNNTSIPDIMKKTNLTKGAFYHHFKNKLEIGKKVIEDILSIRIYNGFIKPLKENKSKSVSDLLVYVFTERIANFTEKEKALGCPANNMINEIGCSVHDFREPLRKLMDGWKDALIDVIDLGKKNNEIKKEVDSNAAATYLICSFEGARGIRKIYNDDALFSNYLEAVKEYIKSIS
ncbi:MAG: TetR/AcrR family transcriptional regulator [Flavobacteriaceae bacterium]|nr:TetR/AcrR family transcriptional regulator [Flavobacteriaceae bacterium]MDG2368856.1 TetR/AcrR family transcriptional regulator [Flavobacteriaceae bacterium]|tara:strand:- start:19273 stop:19878 length:606 start_codon:yes stop_codon:yes gene_type:complete